MKRTFLYIALLLTLSFVSFSAFALTVTGQVSSAMSQQPLPEAQVFAAWNEKTGNQQFVLTETDATGGLICELPENACDPRIGISAENHIPVSLIASNTPVTIALESDRTYSVRGIVHDAENNPIAYAHISFVPENDDYANACRGCDVWTDNKGAFLLSALPVSAGDGNLHVHSTDYVDTRNTKVSPDSGDAFATIALQKGMTIQGKAMFRTQTNSSGICVWARQVKPDEYETDYSKLLNAPFDPIPGCVTYTDENGMFVLQGIPEKAFFTIHAMHPDALPDMVSQPRPAEKHQKYDIDLQLDTELAWALLDVRNEEGDHITNVSAVAKYIKQMKNYMTVVERFIPSHQLQDKRTFIGPFSPYNLESIEIDAPGYKPCNKEIPLQSFATNMISAVLPPPETVRVQLYDLHENKPVTNAIVHIEELDVKPDSNGVFYVQVEDNIYINIEAPDYSRKSQYIYPHMDNVKVYMSKPFSAQIYVYNYDGTPATSGNVRVTFQLDRYGSRGGYEPVGPNGTAVIQNEECLSPHVSFEYVTDGSYRGLASYNSTNFVPGNEYTISLTQMYSRTLRIQVEKAQTNEAEITCTLMNRTDRRRMYSLHPHAESHKELASTYMYTWSFNGISTGLYDIHIFSDTFAPLETNIYITHDTPDPLKLPYNTKYVYPFEIIIRNIDDLQHCRVHLMQSKTRKYINAYPDREKKKYIAKGVEKEARYDVYAEFPGTNIVCKDVSLSMSPLVIDAPSFGTVNGVLQYDAKEKYARIFVNNNYIKRVYSGSFTLPNITTGKMIMRIAVPDYGTTNVFVTVPNDVIDIGDIHLFPSEKVTLRGKIISNSTNTIITCYSINSRETTHINDDRTFAFTNVMADTTVYLHFESMNTNIVIHGTDVDLGSIPVSIETIDK